MKRATVFRFLLSLAFVAGVNFIASHFALALTSASLVGYVPNEYVIKIRPGISIAEFTANLKKRKIDVLQVFGSTRIAKIKITDPNLVDMFVHNGQASIAAAASGSVEFIEPNFVYRLAADEAVPVAVQGDSAAWQLERIRASDVSNLQLPTNQVLVAIIDTGVMISHPSLQSNIWTNPAPGLAKPSGLQPPYVGDVHGYNFRGHTGDPAAELVSKLDAFGFPDDDHKVFEAHGTHVTGVIVARRSGPFKALGIAPNVKVMVLKALGGSWGEGTNADIIEALNYAIDHKVRIINMSWGGPDFSKGVQSVLQQANDAGILVVTAAGNGAPGGNGARIGYDIDQRAFYPASYEASNLISVAATDASDNLAEFSNFGQRGVHLAAPGVDITSTIPVGESLNNLVGSYGTLSGTSMAVPFVTGTAAVLMALDPSLTHLQVKRILLRTVDPVDALRSRISSGGRLNMTAATADVRVAAAAAVQVPTATGQSLRPVSSPIEVPRDPDGTPSHVLNNDVTKALTGFIAQVVHLATIVPKPISDSASQGRISGEEGNSTKPVESRNMKAQAAAEKDDNGQTTFVVYLKPGTDPAKVKAALDGVSNVSVFRQVSKRDDAWRVDFTNTTVSDAAEILRRLEGVRDAEVSGTVQIQMR